MLLVNDEVPLRVSQAMVVEEALQDVRNILQELARILCSRPYCRLSIVEYSSMAPMMTGTNPSFSQFKV
jgi:hypothetical protein